MLSNELNKILTCTCGLAFDFARFCSQGVAKGQKLRVAIIGQSAFAAEVYKLIKKDGHKVVGMFTVPDNGNREDPAGE